MSRGLVLEGGAMRGMFTCGILDYFLEKNISFDGAAAVSAGATFGCNIKSHQKGRALRYNKKYCGDPRYVSYRNLLLTGNIFGVDFCYRRIPFELDIWDYESFQKDPMDFYVVCSDVKSGKPYYHKCREGLERDVEYIRASASMPFVSKIVNIEGRGFLDGGVTDSIPVRFMEEKNYDKLVVILTQPEGYIKKKNSLIPLARLMYHSYPRLIEAIENRHIAYNETLEHIREQERAGRLFVIRPPQALDISHTCSDPKELQRVYDIGRKRAESMEAELADYLLG